MLKLSLVMLLGACSSGGDGDEPSGKLVGAWTGSAAGYLVTADVEAEYASAGTVSVQGIMSTDRPACFTNATLAGSLSLTSVELIASGNGMESGTTVVRIRGELAGDRIDGKLEVSTLSDDCAVAALPIVLMR